MEYLRLGESGLSISRIILGCMSYGAPGGATQSWILGLDESREYFRRALDAGITTFDTANVYSAGTSEEITGKVLGELARRDEVVIATKVFGRMFAGPKGSGLSRGAIMTAIDDSLRRLGTDHVDLYQIHRWDPEVPIEETMEALHDVVKAGKARYIGASSMWAWQFAQAQYTADAGGWTRFVSMQNQYNLIQREEEREMLPLCLDQGVGVIPWSPLAGGRVARDWDESTPRGSADAERAATRYAATEASNRAIVDAVAAVADERGVSRAQVALAWVLRNPAVTAPIFGATKPAHLEDAIASLDIELTDDEVTRLEEHYTPRAPDGF